jgi:hypothetical protein
METTFLFLAAILLGLGTALPTLLDTLARIKRENEMATWEDWRKFFETEDDTED